MRYKEKKEFKEIEVYLFIKEKLVLYEDKENKELKEIRR